VLSTSTRLLHLLTVLQSRRSWTGAELVERLEVTARTLRRDMDRLRRLGYPVQSTTGVAGGYRFGSGSELPPLLLDDDEALVVSLSLRTAAAGNVVGMEEVALRALTKLEQVLPARLRRRLSALNAAIVPLTGRGPVVDARALTAIAAACRDHLQIRFGYQGHDGRSSRREVEPSGLVHTGARWYLVAWDLARADWRTFRVDRIASKVTSGATFFPRRPPEGGLAAYVARSLSAPAHPIKGRVRFHAPIDEMAKRIPAWVGTLESAGARACVLHTGSHSLHDLVAWMAVMGVDFEILEPQGAAGHLRQLAARARRAANASANKRPSSVPTRTTAARQ
jgi:predicted DNA-binding transcriptional regulator YafY